MSVVITTEAFDPWEATRQHQQRLPPGSYGATASFVGSMRDFNQGDRVARMELEHYPGMTEKHLEKIIDEAKQQWDIIDALIVHRVGEIRPDNPIVLTVVWSAHRKDAFEACRYLMEELKTRAPFWKKETTRDGERWVEKNTPGY